MTLKPEETLLIDKVEEAKNKVKNTMGQENSSGSHSAAVVELVTFQADLTKLIFEKMAGIYEEIAGINSMIAGRQLTWGDAAKQMAVRAPYALAAIVIVIVLWFWLCGIRPEMLVTGK